MNNVQTAHFHIIIADGEPVAVKLINGKKHHKVIWAREKKALFSHSAFLLSLNREVQIGLLLKTNFGFEVVKWVSKNIKLSN